MPVITRTRDDGRTEQIFSCTPEDPWTEAKWQRKVAHTGKKFDDTCSQGCCSDYVCVNCDHHWTEEGSD